MLNKNLLFIFFSVLLGFIISYYYNQKFNTEFILYFILISLIVYILFYFLGQDQTKENFSTTKYYNSLDEDNEEEGKYHHKLMHYLSEEEEGKYINKIKDNIKEAKEKIQAKMEDEEESKVTTTQVPTTQVPTTQAPTTSDIIEEELAEVSTTTTLPLNTPYGPLNINISYNSQNSVNEVGGTKCTNSTNGGGSTTPSTPPNNNIGNNLCSNSRVYNNSDWIYGSYAWTNDPDYYIPSEEMKCNRPSYPIPLNELITTRKFRKENDVCPLMVNTPWTEYKTGDSEPEPYNL